MINNTQKHNTSTPDNTHNYDTYCLVRFRQVIKNLTANYKPGYVFMFHSHIKCLKESIIEIEQKHAKKVYTLEK